MYEQEAISGWTMQKLWRFRILSIGGSGKVVFRSLEVCEVLFFNGGLETKELRNMYNMTGPMRVSSRKDCIRKKIGGMYRVKNEITNDINEMLEHGNTSVLLLCTVKRSDDRLRVCIDVGLSLENGGFSLVTGSSKKVSGDHVTLGGRSEASSGDCSHGVSLCCETDRLDVRLLSDCEPPEAFLANSSSEAARSESDRPGVLGTFLQLI